MKLSIIIVNYNVKYFLEQCLLSIDASNFPFDSETIVIDNNSSDNSLEYLTPKFPKVQFIQNIDNPGFAKANNQGIKIANGEYILILNPDTVLGENVLKEVCSFMDNKQDVGAVGVKMINGYGEFLPESKRGFPTPWASFCKIFGLNKIVPNSKLFGKYHLRYLDENKTHCIDVLAGAFIMARKKALEKSGLFDEDFFMYGEDIDLSYRITKAGYKNFYLPQVIIHYKGESTKKDMKYIKVFYEAMYIFFKKHYPHYGKLYSFFITSGIYVRAITSSIKRAFTKIFNIEDKESPQKSIVLDHGILSYEEIIQHMDTIKNKDIDYRIYSPKSGMIIGSHYAEEKTIDKPYVT